MAARPLAKDTATEAVEARGSPRPAATPISDRDEEQPGEGWCSVFGRYGDIIGSGTTGFFTGFLGAMGGVGGGPFCVPLLGALLGLPHKKCLGTSILSGLTTLVVAGSHSFFGKRSGDFPYLPICTIAPIAPMFGYLSVRYIKYMSQKSLRMVFAVFLLCSAFQILSNLLYSPTGVEGHWQYDLLGKGGHANRRGLVYEIERVENQMVFRTQHFHALLEPAAVLKEKPHKDRGRDPGGFTAPVGFEDGWSAPLMNLRNNQQRGTIWVRVLDRGNTLETVFHSRVPQPHWNARVVARRRKGMITQLLTEFVSDWRGNLAFHAMLAVFAGTCSGLLGIAGGSVVVPVLSLTGAFAWHSITTTSLVSMIPTSCVTMVTHYHQGNLVVKLAPGLVVGTFVGALTGSHLMTLIAEVVRQSLCAGVLLFTASIMTMQGLSSEGVFGDREKTSLYKLSGGCILFFCISALLQEKVFNLPEFSHEALLTFVQSVVISALAFIDLRRERKSDAGRHVSRHPCIEPKCPALVYMAVAVLSSTSLLLTNRASKLLDYTTQVVFKSSKLPWVMVCRVLFLRTKKTPSAAEWVWAVVLSCGLAAFTFAGASHRDNLTEEFWVGLTSILGALSCDATLYCVEEGVVFGRFKADTRELILCTHAFSVPTTFLFLLVSGNASSSFHYMQLEWRFPTLIVGAAACTFVGTRCLMQIVQEFDSNRAVTTTLLRKVVTVLLSYWFFPKHFNAMHVFGGVLVAIGAYMSFRASRKDESTYDARVDVELQIDPVSNSMQETPPLHHQVALLSPSMRVASATKLDMH